MNIALADVYHAFHFEVLEKLKEKSACHFSYAMLGTEKTYHGDPNTIKRIIANIFDEDIYTDSPEKLLFPSNIVPLVDEEWTISEQLIRETKHIESYFLRLTDRNAIFHLSIHNRRQYYLLLLNHFNNILKSKKIDLVLAFDTPHNFYAYVFYLLAAHYKIPILRLEHHFFQDHSLLLPFEIPMIPDSYGDGKTTEELWQNLPPRLKDDYNHYNPYISVTNKREKKAIISKSPWSGWRLIYRFLLKASANLIMGGLPFLFKKEVLHFTSLHEIKSRFVYRWRINSVLARLLKLNQYYNRVCEYPDLSQKYIYFGMHMQPEKTSQPQGGEFDHQLLPVILLSKSLPDGWFLYVKEHPNQFNKRIVANANYRSEDFYQTIRRLRNVKLVDFSVPSAELIQHAQLVSTLTGTMGWEALRSGRPVIAFGESYYKACHAVRFPGSVEECQTAIRDLMTLSSENVKHEVYRYLSYYHEHGYLVASARWEDAIPLSSLPRNVQMENLAEALYSRMMMNKTNF